MLLRKMWLNVVIIIDILFGHAYSSCTINSSNVFTQPVDSNVTFTATFSSGATGCQWLLKTLTTGNIFFGNSTCQNNFQDATHRIINRKTQMEITSKLQFIARSNSSGNYTARYFFDTCTFVLEVKNCSTTSSLRVNPSTGTHGWFGSTGYFACLSPGQKLVYKNGTILINNQTTCQSNAKWHGQDGLNCVQVNLTGTSSYSNGTQSSLTCGFDKSVVNSQSIWFQIDGEEFKGNFKLTPKHDGKSVVCVVVLNSGNLTSNQLLLSVTYPPRNVTATVVTHGVKSGSIYLFRSNESVTIKCSSDGNPDPSCSWNISVVSHQCEISRMFNASTNLTCVASNSAGNTSSNTIQIISVNAQRKALILVNSSRSQNSQKVNLSEGQQVTLQCKVENSDKLKTTFSWNKNGVSNGTSPTLVLSNISWNSSASYTCNTNDAFGSLDATITLDVQYPPYQQNNFSMCYLKTLEDCNFNISSNPPIQSAVLTRSETQTIWNLTVNNASTTFEFIFNTSYGNGSYELMVSYNGGFHNFNFTVISGPKPTTTGPPVSPTTTPYKQATPDSVYIAVGASVSGAGVVALVVVLVVRRRKGGKKPDDVSEREERQNPIYATSGDANANGDKDIYTPVNFKAKKNKKANSEKEERANPLYASSSNQDAVQDVYASVDKKKKEKEVRVNPIYDTSVASGSKEITYGVVNKKNKKIKVKSEKEVKVNVLYGASGSGNQLEDAYASVDKSKKNEKEERLNPLYGGVNDVAGSSGDTYSTVNKQNKNKKKKDKKRAPPPNPPNPPDPGEQDADPYAEVDLHGQSSNK